MAVGLKDFTKADVVISTTGIAGPDGGTKEKPVGLVYMCCMAGNVKVTRELNLNGNRAMVRESAVANALILLRECLLEYVSENTFGKNKKDQSIRMGM